MDRRPGVDLEEVLHSISFIMLGKSFSSFITVV